jgi:hypothetical protein
VSSEPLLDKNTILAAFRRLASRLQRHHAVVNVYLFGGGAMVVAFDAREATQDLDARFTSTSAAFREIHAVADEMGLPRWWLNEQGTAYLPRHDEPHALPVYDHPNLRVMRASDRHLLAMKAAASRRNTRDVKDIATLSDRLGLNTPEDVVRVHNEVFPDHPLRADKVAVIAEALGAGRGEGKSGRERPQGHCRACGRALRSPESVAAGIGPICATRGLSR